MRLAIHEQLYDIRAKGPDPGPLGNGVGLGQTPQAQDVKGVSWPVQHGYGFNRGNADRVVRPDAAIEEPNIVLRDVVLEIGRRSGCGKGGINGQGSVIILQAGMMGCLIDVNAPRNRIPCRNHKAGRCFANALVAEDVLKRTTQRIRIVFPSVEPLAYHEVFYRQNLVAHS